MKLEDIMLSEISQSQKDRYCLIPLSREVKCRETENGMVVARGWGEGGWGVIVEWGQSFSFAR